MKKCKEEKKKKDEKRNERKEKKSEMWNGDTEGRSESEVVGCSEAREESNERSGRSHSGVTANSESLQVN